MTCNHRWLILAHESRIVCRICNFTQTIPAQTDTCEHEFIEITTNLSTQHHYRCWMCNTDEFEPFTDIEEL